MGKKKGNSTFTNKREVKKKVLRIEFEIHLAPAASSAESIMLNRANNRILLNSNFWLLFLFILIKSDGFGVEARDKGGDDIILTKGKIIMRGGKGKG